jgi:hypothetical protein
VGEQENNMATAKTKRITIPFLEDNGEPAVYPDDYGLDDPGIGLAKQLTNYMLYNTPVGPELQAIMDDPIRWEEFCEETSLDPEILEQYEDEPTA